jgi:hypothetical protein
MKLSTWFLLPFLASPALASTGLPIINDDYPRARAEALHRHVPIFVEVWAPW